MVLVNRASSAAMTACWNLARFAKRNEFVFCCCGESSLQTALDVHRSGRWIDPPDGHLHKRQPTKGHYTDD
jgi:hypothetical protein